MNGTDVGFVDGRRRMYSISFSEGVLLWETISVAVSAIGDKRTQFFSKDVTPDVGASAVSTLVSVQTNSSRAELNRAEAVFYVNVIPIAEARQVAE